MNDCYFEIFVNAQPAIYPFLCAVIETLIQFVIILYNASESITVGNAIYKLKREKAAIAKH